MNLRCATVLCIIAIIFGCASSQPENDFEMTIGDGAMSLELDRAVLVGMLEDGLNTTLSCDGEVDPEVEAMLEPLQRRRNGKTVTGEGSDRVVAQRRGSRLTLVIGDTRSGHLEATMPWAVGECLLGKATTIEKALGSAPIKVKLTTDEGKTVTAELR